MKYISEEELRKWLITDGCEEGHGYIDEDDFVCMDWQDNPIKTGHWIETETDDPYWYRCSRCNRRIDDRENYCPSCGARMTESEKV